MMHKKLVIAAVLALVCLGAEAKRKGDGPTYELRRHEISASIAGAPTRSVIGGFSYPFMGEYDLGYGFESLTNTYFGASTYQIERTTPFISINYFYNKNHRWAFGASLSYERATEAFYSRKDGSLINKDSKNVITAMVYARLSWLNRKHVRMYSMTGMGRSFSLEGEFYGDGEGFAMQVVPIGISVGKDLYGFAEAGLGTSYFGINLGMGYRF